MTSSEPERVRFVVTEAAFRRRDAMAATGYGRGRVAPPGLLQQSCVKGVGGTWSHPRRRAPARGSCPQNRFRFYKYFLGRVQVSVSRT